MRAIVLDDEGLGLRSWPEPKVGARDVLVAVEVAGICGSDVHLGIERSVPTAIMPIVLGHETVGYVREFGAEVEGLEVGDRVAISPVLSCEECAQCRRGRPSICSKRSILGVDRDGSWSDLVSVPSRAVIAVPPEVPDAIAAVAVDAIATAYHAIRTRGQLNSRDRLIVWGAGGLGTAAIGIARGLGATGIVAVDPSESARIRALETGAEIALHPDEADGWREETGGADLSLEFVGHEDSVLGAISSLDVGGRAVLVGITEQAGTFGTIRSLVKNECQIIGSFSAGVEEIAEVFELLSSRKLDLADFVRESVSLDEVPGALVRLQQGETAGARLVINVREQRSSEERDATKG
jgi:D-arabinose 1-dehydrogenase-like Zn-dependent alcohol dehydrogenase